MQSQAQDLLAFGWYDHPATCLPIKHLGMVTLLIGGQIS